MKSEGLLTLSSCVCVVFYYVFNSLLTGANVFKSGTGMEIIICIELIVCIELLEVLYVTEIF